MEIQDSKSTLQVIPRNNEKIKKIWKTAGILLAITVAEFVMAFTMDRGILLYALFIILTIWKAKYIMMEFMHLGDEVKPLFYSIIVPLIFLVWLLIALAKEGSDIFMMRW
ncbi:cytochrome C oxidase subunit IV family protein [Algoriphagus limi]|uniref:Cytochrome C oxidase subunit IV family protein n=1 Tax=Algoriphagus limi TaxID=2975273 RepID=A0ABT2GD59_9BACT|nr:cytochrome C oxidase subunit IV family protein [Algoriphagus limi]MCS5491857.1 cytochrome C oxidase subunit IV family protein [Algoriphagus limi]